jgi:hypothetical protein
MRGFQMISGILFQSNSIATKDIAMPLEGTVLIPCVMAIIILVMVAGIAVTVQKHKRY